MVDPADRARRIAWRPSLRRFVERLGIARNVLAKRLNTLVVAGILDRQAYDEARGRYECLLTNKGRALWPVITALRQWGDEWILGEGNEPLVVEHRTCGHDTTAQMTCDACGEPVDARSVRAKPGPGARRDSRSQIDDIRDCSTRRHEIRNAPWSAHHGAS